MNNDLNTRPEDLKLGDVIYLDVTLSATRGKPTTRRTAFAVNQLRADLGQAQAQSSYQCYARCGRTGKKLWRACLEAHWRHGSWCIDRTYYRLNRNTGRVHSWNDVDPSFTLTWQAARITPEPAPGAFDDCYSG